MIKKVALFCILLFCVAKLEAQSQFGYPFVYNYPPSVYHAHNQVWGAWQSDNGLMYFCGGDGLMTFDGTYWQLFRLPDSKTPLCIVKDDNGTVYVGGDLLFGKLSVDSTGNLKFISLENKLNADFKSNFVVRNLVIIDSNIIIRSDKQLEIITKYGAKTLNINKTYSFFQDSKNNAFFIGPKIIYKYSKDAKDQLTSIASTDPARVMFERNDSVFLLTANSKLFYLQKNNELKFISDFYFDVSNIMISSFKYIEDKFYISTHDSGFYIFDSHGNILTHLDVNSGLISSSIYSFFIDKNKNVWCMTNNGISYIDFHSPYRIIDKRYSMDISNPFNIFNIDNKIYTTAGYKFCSIDISNKYPVVQQVANIINQTWKVVKINDAIYTCHNTRILRIDKDSNVKAFGPVDNMWDIAKIPATSDTYLVSGSSGLYVFKFYEDSLHYIKKIKNYGFKTRSLLFDKFNNLWVYVQNQGINRITLTNDFEIKNIEHYYTEKGLSNVNSIQFFLWKDILLISTYKTLFQYDYAKDSIYEFHQIADNYDHSGKKILQMVGIDSIGNFWFEYHDDFENTNLFCLTYKDNKFQEIYKTPRRLYGNGIAGIISLSKTRVFLALTSSYAVLDLDSTIGKDKFMATIKKVSFIKTDSVVFNGFSLNSDSSFSESQNGSIKFKYANRNLRFTYSSFFYIEPQGISYRYKLVNYDDEWSPWTYETKKDYTNLPPDTYTFVVEARNIYDQISEQATYKFRILPPWYRTFWAYSVYFILFVLMFYFVVKFYSRRLKKQNLHLEQLVKERTSEISAQNAELMQQREEIMSQRDEIMAQRDELSEVNSMLEKLSVVASETDNSVFIINIDGDFLWANDAFERIYGYPFDDFTLLHKNFFNYFDDYEFTEKLKHILIEEKKSFVYESKITTKDGREVWLQTTINPIFGELENIKFFAAVEADISKIKQYEDEIIHKNEQLSEKNEFIESSINYAKTIQQAVLPTQSTFEKYFGCFIIYRPKNVVSGDFYWMVEKENYIFMAVADCTGHGVPGAFMSLISSRILTSIIVEKNIFNPNEILSELDNQIIASLNSKKNNIQDGLDIALCRLNKTEIGFDIAYVGAKRSLYYFDAENKSFNRLQGSARSIGGYSGLTKTLSFENSHISVKSNDVFYMFSDGFTDQNNSKRRKFTSAKLLRILQQIAILDIAEQKNILITELDNWQEGEMQRDDITMLGFKIR